MDLSSVELELSMLGLNRPLKELNALISRLLCRVGLPGDVELLRREVNVENRTEGERHCLLL